ncbi:MAG: hypothetical protein ABR978_07505 [Dehalococcoidia bacterium]|jgi:hypothetical protein
MIRAWRRRRPITFIQWKGTDICIDLHCPCGMSGHYDGYFAYALKCPDCGRVYVLAEKIDLRKATRKEREQLPVQEVVAWALEG